MDTAPGEKLTEMPFLRNVGLIVTYQCQVSCPHCILQAGPQRKERMSISMACHWIEEIAAYHDKYVWVLALTGGEPFYNLHDLREISNFASRFNLLVSAVTNAFWASTRKRATEVLESLPSIRMIQVSTDLYHLQSIPFEWVKNAILAAQDLNIPCSVAVCTENEAGSQYQEIIQRLSDLVDRSLIYTAITFHVGRAAGNIDLTRYPVSQDPPISACTAGSAPIIFPDGQVIACIGPVIDLTIRHPLVLGDLRKDSLETIFERAQVNPILHAIRIWGPSLLIQMLQDEGLNNLLQKSYLGNSICNACYYLMANPQIVSKLEMLASDADFQRKVAYGRVYYLKEMEMVKLLGLHG